MARNPDGTGTCDRCGIVLVGYGVIYGMVCDDLDPDTGQVRHWIFCYRNNCRNVVLSNLLNFFGTDPQAPRCTHDNTALAVRGIAEAMLTVDVHPGTGEARALQFCYATGSRDLLLSNRNL